MGSHKLDQGVTPIVIAVSDVMSSPYQINMVPGIWFPALTCQMTSIPQKFARTTWNGLFLPGLAWFYVSSSAPCYIIVCRDLDYSDILQNTLFYYIGNTI